MPKKKIIAIVGSLRKESINLQLAEAMKKIVDETAEMEIVVPSDIPMFNQDHEFPAPEGVKALREKILAADGIWFFTPEYNHAIPAVMKNVIDWMSRPATAKDPQVLNAKKAAYSGIGFGIDGTQGAQDDLVRVLSFLNVNMMHSPRLTIPNAFTQMEGSRLVLKESAPYLKKQADAFLNFLG